MGSSSLIHLFRWWLLEFTALLCGWSCLSLNFLSDSTGSAPLPLVHRRLDIALLKRPKAVLSRQHHEFGTLLLSFCDWWGLCSLPQLFFLSKSESIQIANPVCHCGCRPGSFLGFQTNLHPWCCENKIPIFLPGITVVLLDTGKLLFSLSN